NETKTGNTILWDIDERNPKNYTVYRNNTVVDSDILTQSTVLVNVDGLGLGTYNFTIIVYDDAGNFETQKIEVTVFDGTKPLVVGPNSIIYDEGNDAGRTIRWNITETHPTFYTITRNGMEIVPQTSWTTEDPISLNIEGLSIGTYTFIIELTDTSGQVGTNTVVVTVKDPQIQETKLVNFEIERFVYEGDIETLSVDGWETDVGGNIDVATVNATLIAIDVSGFNKGDIVKQLSITSVDGKFALVLNYTGLLNGTYEWRFTFQKELHETQITPLEAHIVKILPHVLTIDITFQSTLTKGKEFQISARVSYNDPRNVSTSLGLNDLTSRAGGVPNIEVAFILTYLATTGSDATLIETITTDSNGDAVWILTSDATDFIENILSISATIADQSGYTDTGMEVIPELNVKKGSAFFGLIDDISAFIEEFLAIILAILATVFIVIIYFLRTLSKRKQKFTVFAKESEDATVEIDGLRSIHGIIMTAGTTGIPFYEYIFSSARTTIDTALISGISTALSMFLNELDEEKLGFEHMERAGVSITSHKGDLSTMMVISDAPLPPIILEQLEQGHKAVESKFSKQMMIPDRIMDIEPINITNELVSASLKLNLKEDIILRTNNLKKLQKRKSISRKIRNDMNALFKLAKLSDETQEPLNLEMILAFLESEKIDHSTTCRIIYLSYMNFIIVPI
ncbi:MAG: hypothetical protein ACC656_03565, partial [Candidatus Heimdallarchaeota archaeon]